MCALKTCWVKSTGVRVGVFPKKGLTEEQRFVEFEVITRYMYEQYCLISVDQFVCVIYAVRAFKHAWQTHNDTMRWRFVGSVKHIISFVSTTIACWFRKLLESNANINKLVVAWEPWYIAQRPKVDILWLHCGLGIEVKVSQLGWSPLETAVWKVISMRVSTISKLLWVWS